HVRNVCLHMRRLEHTTKYLLFIFTRDVIHLDHSLPPVKEREVLNVGTCYIQAGLIAHAVSVRRTDDAVLWMKFEHFIRLMHQKASVCTDRTLHYECSFGWTRIHLIQ